MDKFTELYNYLKEEGLTDLSAEQFKVEYAAGTAKNTELYSYLRDEKLTDLDAERFNVEYFTALEKKNPIETSPSNVEEVITDSTTETPEVVDTSVVSTTVETPLDSNVVVDDTESETMVTEYPAYDPREQGKDINANTITYDSTDSQFDKSLAFVTKDLIDREESEVVNRMKYHFEDYGFDFEQGGSMFDGLDGMTVTSKDDPSQSININLDPVFGDVFGGESGPAQELKEFLKANRRTDNKMAELTTGYDRNRKKYFSIEGTKSDIAEVENKARALNTRYNVYLEAQTTQEYEMDALMGQSPEVQATPEWQLAYQNSLAAGKRLQQTKNGLGNSFNEYKKLKTVVDSTVGNYVDMKEADDSTYVGGLINTLVGPGVSDVLAGAWGAGVDGFYKVVQTLNEDFGMTPEEKKARYIDIARDLKYPVPENIEDEAVYKKWLEGMQDQGIGDDKVEDELSLSEFPKETLERLEADGFDLSKTLNGQYFNKNQSGLNKFLSGEYIDLPDYAYDKTRGERLKRLVLDQEVKENKNPQKDFVKKYLNEILSQDDISDEKFMKQNRDGVADFLGIPVTEGLTGLAKSLPSVLVTYLSRGKIKPAVGFAAAKRNIVAKALGLTTKGGIAQTVSFSLLQAEAMNEEMNNDPDFQYVTESERKNIVIPTAITVGILERLGFRHLVTNKTILAGVMNKVTNMLPKGATAVMFKNTMDRVVKNSITKGLFSNKGVKATMEFSKRVAGATLSEAETGGMQQAFEMGYKDVWNNMNNKDMFNQPEMWSAEFFKTVGHAAAAEAVGGFVMGVPGAVINAAKRGSADLISDDMVELFDQIANDEVTVESHKAKLDLEVASGTKTQKEVDQEMLDFKTLTGALKDLPSDMDANSRKKGLILVFEQQKLEAEMAKMNKNLKSYKQKEARVKEIKESIGQLGTNQAKANTNFKNETEGIQESVLVTEEDATKSLQDKGVQNPTVEQIKTEQDALQKQSTTSLDAQESSTGSETVGQNLSNEQSTNEGDTTSENENETETEEEVSKEEQDDIDTFFGETVLDDVENTSDNLSINRKQKEGGTEIKNTSLAAAVVNKAKKAARSIAKLAPEVKMVLHDTQAEYEKYATKGSRGYYNPNSKVIHINLTKAKGNTVAHEVFHAVFLEKISGGDIQAQLAAKKLITAVRKTLPADSMLSKRIDKFAQNYDENIKNEEKLAELFSLMSNEYKTLKKPAKNKIIEFIRSMASKLGVTIPGGFGKTDESVIDFMNTFSKKVRTGTEITEGDVDILNKIDKELDVEQEQGDSGQVGTFTFEGRESKAPDINTDTRSYAENIIQKDLQDYEGQNFVTNMYDFTNAGPTDIGAGIVLDLYGGKNYVADMMEKAGSKIGEVSNLAAFNSKENAEGFIKNAIEGDANLFSPHVGTKEGSWQFQQNIFAQLTEKLLDNNVITNEELIESFNSGLTSKDGKEALKIFNEKNKTNLTNLNDFIENPKKLVELLDIDNNYSPDLRKILNDKIAANKKVQKALGVKNKIEFAEKLEDPMNVGSKPFDLIGVIEFDNTTFETPSRPKKGDADYHPSFAWTVKAKIKAIVQPTNFYQSTEATDSYTKFNKDEVVVSTKTDLKDSKGKSVEKLYKIALKDTRKYRTNKQGKKVIASGKAPFSGTFEDFQKGRFKSSNVSSSAGSGPKVATVKSEIREGREQQAVKDVYKSNPKLNSIGTLQQYNEYLKTIFPNSQVKDFVYHGGNENIQQFSKEKLGETTKADSAKLGFFFSNNKDVSLTYIERYYLEAIGELKVKVDEFNETYKKLRESTKNEYSESADLYVKSKRLLTQILDYIKKLLNDKFITSSELYKKQLKKAQEASKKFENFSRTARKPSLEISMVSDEQLAKNYAVKVRQIENKQLYTVLLDIKNPFKANIRDNKYGGRFFVDSVSEAVKNNNDSAILEDVYDVNTTPKELKTDRDKYVGNDYVVFESNQIHILGSNKDIKDFKDFKSPSRQGREQSTEQQIKDQTGMPASGYYSAQAMVSDIQRQFNRIGPGYTAKRAKKGAYGGGGGVFVNGPKGRVKNPTRRGRQQVMDNEDDILRIIYAGRQEGGFPDAAILDYLKRRKRKVDGKTKPAFTAKEISSAFKVVQDEAFDSYMFREYPKSFNDLKGGFLAGLKLMKKVDNYYKKLVEKNNLIKKRIKKNIKTKEVPLSEEQLNLKVLDFFMDQAIYKSAGVKGKRQTSQQLAMERDMLQILLPDPLKANPQRIAAINKRIKNIKFDDKNLKGVQRALRNYIRMVLPRDLYSKKEITDLIDEVNRVTATNFESVKDEVFKKVTKKTNESLETSLFKILNKEYTVIQSGRLKGVKIDNKIRKKLNRINKLIVSPDATSDQIIEANVALLDQYNKIKKEEVEGEKGGDVIIVNKTEFSENDLEAMAEITLAMQINTSFTQEMNDPNKTTQLSSVISSLNQIEATGKANLEYQLLQDAIKYRENERAVYKDMTGIDIDAKQSLIDQGIPENEITEHMITKEFQAIKKDLSLDAKERGGLKAKNVIARFRGSLKSLAAAIEQGVFGTAEDMTGLIDRISTQPGEIFEGATQDITQKEIRKASRMFKGRMLNQQLIFSEKMTELFGKRWTAVNRKNSSSTETIVRSVVKDEMLRDQLNEVQKVITKKNKSEVAAKVKEIQKKIQENTIDISQNQLMYYYSQMQDPSLKQSMINTFDATRLGNETFKNEFESRIRQEIADKLDNKLIQLSEWMVGEYYPEAYEHYNNTYKEIYRTDMPWNQFYAGRVYRQNENDAEGLDLLADSQSWITNVGSASSKARQANTNPINKTDGVDALLNYTKDMEYFAAYAVPIRNINKIFQSPLIKETIKDKFGPEIWKYINDSITKIANKGIQNQNETAIINAFNNTFLLSRLGLNPTLILKQMTSFVTYGNDIGYINWVKNAAMSTVKARTLVKEVLDNSVVLQDRYGQSITRTVENYSDDKFERMNGGLLQRFGLTNEKQDQISKILMWTTMAGDKGAILVGGVPNYLYYKNKFKKANPNATEQEAIDHAIIKFEADTLRTQQSYDLQDKDYFQTKGAIVRAFNMFLTTPKQYFRREIIAFRNMYRIIKSRGKEGKGVLKDNGELDYVRSLTKAGRSLAVYHVVMPVLFQWVSQGLPGLLRGADDEDKADLVRAGILGNLNALFILGKVAESIIEASAGKPWVGTPSTIPVLGQTALLAKLYTDIGKIKDPVKRQEKVNKFMSEAIALTGIPAGQLRKMMSNFSTIGESKDLGSFILKLFNFSKYAQGDKGGKTERGLFDLTQAEMKKYNPEMYKRQQELKERMPKPRDIQKEIKAEIRKKLLDEIYD